MSANRGRRLTFTGAKLAWRSLCPVYGRENTIGSYEQEHDDEKRTVFGRINYTLRFWDRVLCAVVANDELGGDAF